MPEITFKKGINNAVAEKVLKVAIVFSGGQSPGGHNVIAGLFDGLKIASRKNTLIGYLGRSFGNFGE